MVRLEELPDGDANSQPDISNMPVLNPVSEEAENAFMDDLYDRAAARGGLTDKTFEEALSDMSKTPLFMSSLNDAGDGEENVALEALRSLQYEGTAADVMQNFKERGNEAVEEKNWKDAKEFYTKGLAVLRAKDSDRLDKPEDPVEEARRLVLLEEQLYINRARCNLELQNYRSTTLDCAGALKLNPKNVKAHYRSASALFALDKVYEALDVCYRGLKLDEGNQPMKVLLEKIQKRSRVKEEKDRKRRAEQEQKQKERIMLVTALKARDIKVKGSLRPPDMADAAVRLVPDPLSPTSTLEFPTMFLYPMHNQSDFVKAFAEKDAIYQHLSYIFPAPWDERSEYKTSTVDCYLDTKTGGMMKIGKKMPLLEILSNDKVEVVDGLVRIHVVPQSLAPKWIEEVKKKRAK